MYVTYTPEAKSCVSLYDKLFLSYGPIFGKAAYFHSMGSGFRDTGRFSKLPYLNMKLSKWPKFLKLHIYTLSTPRGRNWAYFCSTGSGSRYAGQFSKSPYFGMKLGKWLKFQKLHIYDLNCSRVPNFTLFCSTVARFPDNWGFWFGYRVQWWIWNFLKKRVPC